MSKMEFTVDEVLEKYYFWIVYLISTIRVIEEEE
jgi:hypothetical protein